MTNTSISAPPRPQTNRRGDAIRFAEVNGTRIRYIEAGADHPGLPVVLLHGYQAGGDYWYPHLLPALCAERRVIAPDIPGFGYSGRLPSYNLSAFAKIINAFLDALGIEQTGLLGHSMGGQVAIATAAEQPARIRKLVLVDSAGLARTEPRWQVPIKMIADRSTFHVGIYPTMIRLSTRATALRPALQMLQSEFVDGYLPRLTMPTLIVWGSRDRIVPLEHGVFLVKQIPGARIAIIRGAGHMPFYQKPQEFNRIVLSFLRRPE